MDNIDEGNVNTQFESLRRFSKVLHEKKVAKDASSNIRVVAFVGAGPSKAAGLPLGVGLKDLIYKKFINDERRAKEIFNAEYKSYKGSDFKSYDLESLSLFEFAAVLSRFAYGKNIIIDTIKSELSKASHRPISYELLAHFAKHRYIDHFIILNFDRLLSDALEDELFEGDLKIIKIPEDIPKTSKDSRHVCYAVYPFGLLGEASRYSLTTEDVAEFGSEHVREFIKNELFELKIEKNEQIVIILIGYRGVEPAFERLLRSIKVNKRTIEIFVINPEKDDSKKFSKLEKEEIIHSITHINLKADLAFELLFELLKDAWGANNQHSWVSAARHRILSKLFNCVNMPRKERFIIELLLQGIKSRGFVHLEMFGKVPRLIKYSDDKSSDAIKDLTAEKLLNPDEWLFEEKKINILPDPKFYVPNYTIGQMDKVILKFMQLSDRSKYKIEEWFLSEDKNKFHYEEIDSKVFLEKELGKIQTAPDIEIVRDVDPEVKWILGNDKSHVKELLSIDQLKQRTEKIIGSLVLDKEKDIPVTVRGIWSTGEWLFWKNAWAVDLGDKLLSKNYVAFKILITKAGGTNIVRSNRRIEVIKKLQKYKSSHTGANIEMKWINWWEMNRILTIVSCDDKQYAIHMRRRLNSPLVCPYYISSQAENALKYLNELWDLYWIRGEVIPDS